MASFETTLGGLRQERHPLVALMVLALTVRFCVVILVTALSPEASAAADLSNLCRPSNQEQSFSGSHDLLACQCGYVCVHGCALGPCLPGVSSAMSVLERDRTVPLEGADRPVYTAGKGCTISIRGPPVFLI